MGKNTGRHRVTVVVQWAKASGIHGYVAGSIPRYPDTYCIIKKINVLRSTKKQTKKQQQQNTGKNDPKGVNIGMLQQVEMYPWRGEE